MKLNARLLAVSALMAVCTASFAQSTATTVQRDVNQQRRIEDGLKSGELTVQEAGKLEREESHIDKLQSRELKDGHLSDAERARLRAAQNRARADITRLENNGQVSSPNSRSAKRMEADVQHNINQQRRIEAGLQDGSLSRREVGQLERGQAAVNHKEAVAAHNGHIARGEQIAVNRAERRQSARIHHERTDGGGAN
ncbi:hypothetical protein CS062_17660 [Roseateles chitinivorans]|uniref:DUF4148 domain-containing protein n=2 Tax=Roseateles chitinivorans TaxID=2917965 RepID=A0A2G9C682_9BURK|nr:hypothetical protein CS062_17660 [Roseateles chitinivorans]